MSSCTWAIGATAYSVLAAKYSSPAVNFGRALVALPLFMLAYSLSSGEGVAALAQIFALDGAKWLWFTASIVGSFALGDTFFLLSTHAIGVPAALAIASIYPIWSALAGWIFLGNPFHPASAIGVLLVVVGTVLVILNGKRNAEAGPERGRRAYWIGITLAFATSLFWAMNAYALSVASQGLSPVFGSIIRALISLILCPVVGLVLYRSAFRLIPPRVLGASLWVFVLEACVGSFLFLYGLSHSPLATAAALSSLSPVIALGIAWGLGRERPSFANLVAISTVILGIWCLVALAA